MISPFLTTGTGACSSLAFLVSSTLTSDALLPLDSIASSSTSTLIFFFLFFGVVPSSPFALADSEQRKALVEQIAGCRSTRDNSLLLTNGTDLETGLADVWNDCTRNTNCNTAVVMRRRNAKECIMFPLFPPGVFSPQNTHVQVRNWLSVSCSAKIGRGLCRGQQEDRWARMRRWGDDERQRDERWERDVKVGSRVKGQGLLASTSTAAFPADRHHTCLAAQNVRSAEGMDTEKQHTPTQAHTEMTTAARREQSRWERVGPKCQMGGCSARACSLPPQSASTADAGP